MKTLRKILWENSGHLELSFSYFTSEGRKKKTNLKKPPEFLAQAEFKIKRG